jgi:glycosyltransferase involved in cell wall biosynthesis
MPLGYASGMSATPTAHSRPAAHAVERGRPSISVGVPVYNEAESVLELVTSIAAVFTRMQAPYEILFVDDGSTDGTFDAIAGARAAEPAVRAIRFRRNYGKSAALAAGFREARGDLIVTMDGDLQDDPREIPKLVAKLDEGYDLVSGWKLVRRDPWTKTVPSRFYNLVTRKLSGLDLHDFNCGLKVYRREVTESISVYGDLHRYLPALAHFAGFRVGEAPVEHHPRRHGTSKFGPARFLNGLLDLLGVMFLHAKARSPLHFFGRLGLYSGVAGFLICLWFLIEWCLGSPLRVRPLMLFGVVLIILGMQFLSMGFLGELIAKERGSEPYPIRDRLEE